MTFTFGPYSKAIVAAAGAVGTWLVAALADGNVSPQEWAALVVAILTALGVYQVSNVSKDAQR